MKKIILAIILSLFGAVAESQAQVQLSIFKGTWQYQNGNQVFMVKFWLEDGNTVGRYKMITVDSSGNQTGVVYNSTDKWGNSPYAPKYEINCDQGSTSGTLWGLINDTTVNDPYGDFITGNIIIKVISGSSSPIIATWEVERRSGIHIEGTPDFNIPTNITLTKVSNIPYAD